MDGSAGPKITKRLRTIRTAVDSETELCAILAFTDMKAYLDEAEEWYAGVVEGY
jgi:hypothetical protein